VETCTRLGRHRWVVERFLAWLTGYRRLTIRYERCARLFTACLTLAATRDLLQEAHHVRQALTNKIARKLTPNGTGMPGRTRSAAEAQVTHHKRRLWSELGSTYQQSCQ
jgi:hypothetical protein